MPTIRIVPSAYSFSNTSYCSISNADNMYNNTDNTTYATFTHSRSSTTAYYMYIKGFDLSQIPEGAIINSFSIKIKGYETSCSTTSSYGPAVYNGTSALESASEAFSTSTKTITLGESLTWDQLTSASDLSIRVGCRRSSRRTQGYIYIYGAEIEVDYTLPVYHNITTTLNKIGKGDGTIDPAAGSYQYLEEKSFKLSIYPTSDNFKVKVTDNGIDISSSLVQELVPSGGTATAIIASDGYTLESGSISYNEESFSQAVGNGSDTDQNITTNGYASWSENAIVKYTFDDLGVPSNATITALSISVKGHKESTSSSSEKCDCTIYNGSAAISETGEFSSTSAEVITVTATTLPAVSELANVCLKVEVGYYGGAIDGATISVTYTVPGSGLHYYYYNLDSLTSDHSFIVTISAQTIFAKENGTWKVYTRGWKKIDGTWVEQSDLSTLFDTSKYKYKRGN